MHIGHKIKENQEDDYPKNQDIDYLCGVGRSEQLRRPTQGISLTKQCSFLNLGEVRQNETFIFILQNARVCLIHS